MTENQYYTGGIEISTAENPQTVVQKKRSLCQNWRSK
jgi:hypothetical protein